MPLAPHLRKVKMCPGHGQKFGLIYAEKWPFKLEKVPLSMSYSGFVSVLAHISIALLTTWMKN